MTYPDILAISRGLGKTDKNGQICDQKSSVAMETRQNHFSLKQANFGQKSPNFQDTMLKNLEPSTSQTTLTLSTNPYVSNRV